MTTLELQKKQTEEHQTFLEQQTELRACRQSPVYFLRKYGRIRDPISGVIPWEPWPHLIQLLGWLHEYRFIIILKPKQIGVTWTLAGDNLHLAQFHEGANILTLSKGEVQATESLDYSRFMHSQLPLFLRMAIGKDQEGLLAFPSMLSKIRALSSTKDTGVGFGGATRVVLDEFEYHEFDRQNYSELLPPILKGGQLVIMSTADSLKGNSLFKELYTAAKHGDNNFYPIFFPYDVVPGRDEKWREEARKTSNLPDYAFNCRFPRSEQEALTVYEVLQYFNGKILESMKMDCRHPIEHELSNKYPTIRIYKPSAPTQRYCGFTDPSDGRDDPHASIFINARTNEQVAESHGKIRVEQVAKIHDELTRYYNNAFNNYDARATSGGTMARILHELETPNICAQIKATGKLDEKEKGFWTTEPLRKKALEGLDEAIVNRDIVIYNPEILDEFANFVQVAGDKPKARAGSHDDYVMAWAGLLETKRYMKLTPGTITIRSFPVRI